jgi:flagellar biosynthetic protein FliR
VILDSATPVAPVAQVLQALRRSGIDVPALGLAWARAMPVVTLVPAFGLRAVPGPARPAMALALAAGIFPALAPVAHTSSAPWLVTALVEGARGVPVAIAAAVPLWAATMAGGVADSLRQAPEWLDVPTVEERTTPLAVLMSLLACVFFLSAGGPAAVASALAEPAATASPLQATADVLVSGISLAVAVASPVIAASIVIELAAALISRATAPTQMAAMIAPLRTMGVLVVFALLLERIANAWARAL